MYFGEGGRSVFTDDERGGEERKKENDDLLHVQSAQKCVFHHPGETCWFMFVGEETFASPNKLRIYHHSIISSPL